MGSREQKPSDREMTTMLEIMQKGKLEAASECEEIASREMHRHREDLLHAAERREIKIARLQTAERIRFLIQQAFK